MARVFVGFFVVFCALVALSFGSSLHCQRLPSPRGGSCVVYGDRATYRCHSGYKLHGASVRYCRYGKWDGRAPVCVPVCPALRAPHYGHVNIDGVKARFSCNTGYKLHGQSQIYCVNGQWHGTTPECRKDERCPRLQNPAYGYVTVRDSWAVYVCNTGYWLDGNSKRKCVNGHWVPSYAPRCRRKTDRDESDDESDDDSEDESDDDSDSEKHYDSDTDTDRHTDTDRDTDTDTDHRSDNTSDHDSDSNGSDSDRQHRRPYGDDSDNSDSDGSDDDHHRSRYGQDSDGDSDGSEDSDDDRRHYGDDSYSDDDSDDDSDNSDGKGRQHGDDSDSDSDGHKRRYGDNSDSDGSDSDNSDNKHGKHGKHDQSDTDSDNGSDSDDGRQEKHYG